MKAHLTRLASSALIFQLSKVISSITKHFIYGYEILTS
nr:MAG TPA: hypothetical protein [Caudoviricetes sp.]DAO43069.1 MAG TPA: hypothetical protein [Caudoviricetes sp.]